MEEEKNRIDGESWTITVNDFDLDPRAMKVLVKTIDDVLKEGIARDNSETMEKAREYENSSEEITKEGIA